MHLDVPQIEIMLEERDPWANPMQAKGIGELGICDAASSITNAIYNACGVRVGEYPAARQGACRTAVAPGSRPNVAAAGRRSI